MYYIYNQRYGRSYEYIFMTLILKINRQCEVIYSSFSEIPDLRNVKIRTHHDQLCIIITSLVANRQVDESLT